MRSFQLPVDHATREVARLCELRAYEMLDTPSEPVFDDITNLAAHLCGCPIALISLVDEHRLWFKAATGLNAREVPRTTALCCDAIWTDEDLFIVRDTHRDPRCKDHVLVTAPPHIRFYAAAPLRMPNAHALGTLCVIDHRPHLLTTPQRNGLRALARQVIAQFELKRTVAELRRAAAARERAEQERERLVGELQRALAQVKTLSGFLPICATCKNIRTDAGYWQRIESYLCERSDVEFSHGICPVCLEKLYPEFAAAKRREQ